MAALGLIQRLAGIGALCLTALLVPLSVSQRIAVLTALGLGLAWASVLPGLERWAPRAVGPVVLLLAVTPPTAVWAPVQLVAVLVAGVAGFDRRAMVRLAPALGLPLLTALLRSGVVLPGRAVAAWAALVAVVVLIEAQVPDRVAVQRARGAGSSSDPDPVGVRAAWGTATLTLIVVVSVAAAGPVANSAAAILPPSLADVGARAGGEAPVEGSTASGLHQAGHPGFGGGLDAGEPVVLDDEIVLRVAADRPLLWRATTYDHWDGRRWTAVPSPPDEAASATTEELGAVEVSGLDDVPDSVEVEQRFTVVGAGLDVVAGAWAPTAVSVPGRTVVTAADGTRRLDRPLDPGDTWEVVSTVRPVEAAHLRRADPARLPTDHPVLVRYAHEDDVPATVAQLAAEITADAPSTYDAVVALEAWMDANLTYTRDIERLAPGRDVISNLLFVDRRGFCEQIGSALVVMLRSLGIPARLVVGWVPSSYDATTGEWLSRGTDAHAWAEVYFPGIGWQGFDPTAGVPLAGSDPVLLRTSDGGAAPGLPAMPLVLGLVVAAAVAVTIAMIVGIPWAGLGRVGRVGGRRRWRLGSGRGGSELDAAEALRHFDGVGAEVGLTWGPTMTLREKGTELVGLGVDAEVIERLVRVLEQVLYLPVADREAQVERHDELQLLLGQLDWCVAIHALNEPASR